MQVITEVVDTADKHSDIHIEDLLKNVMSNLEDNKADDITAINLSGKTSIADYMVIATGRSARQVAALTDYVVRGLKDLGHKEIVIQGLAQADWVLVDAGDIIVHLFRPEVRDFYNLDKMWLPDITDLTEPSDIDAAVLDDRDNVKAPSH